MSKLTEMQCNIYQVMAKAEPIDTQSIAHKMKVSPQTLYTNIKRMKDAGWIEVAGEENHGGRNLKLYKRTPAFRTAYSNRHTCAPEKKLDKAVLHAIIHRKWSREGSALYEQTRYMH